MGVLCNLRRVATTTLVVIPNYLLNLYLALARSWRRAADLLFKLGVASINHLLARLVEDLIDWIWGEVWIRVRDVLHSLSWNAAQVLMSTWIACNSLFLKLERTMRRSLATWRRRHILAWTSCKNLLSSMLTCCIWARSSRALRSLITWYYSMRCVVTWLHRERWMSYF